MKRKHKILLVFLLVFILISLFSLNLIRYIDISNLNRECIAIDTVELIIGTLLIYGFQLEKFENERKQDTVVDLLYGEVFLLISDLLSRYISGYGNYTIQYIVCTIPFLLMIVETYLYWCMIVYTLEDHQLKKYDCIMESIAIIDVVIVMLNIPFHYIFYITDHLRYNEATTYLISYIGPLCMFGLIIYAVMHSDHYKEVKRLLLYMICPLLIATISRIDALLYTALLCSMLLIYIDFHYSRQLTLLKKNQLLLEKEHALQEYQTREMISQIQPHFIYNTLGSISMLYEIDPKKAAEATNQFAKYLRSNIDTINKHDLVSFKTEIDHIQNYISLEKIRFEDLNVEFKVENMDFIVPSLAIQTLVENAVKHGIMAKEEGGKLTIEEIEDPRGHLIKIKDNGIGFDPKDTTVNYPYGGISNSKYRIQRQVNGTLDIVSVKNRGTIVKILIPYESK